MALTVAGAGGCVPDNHPLPAAGTVEILLDNDRPIYAADQIDDLTGFPVLPRQQPYAKRVQLLLSDSQQPDEGAYVDVRLDPPGVLVPAGVGVNRDGLVAIDDTCEQLAGAFRCTADEDGYANFVVRSESDWSGTIAVKISGRSEEKSFEVKPAGLPMDATGFSMIIGGLDQNTDKIAASYSRLACHAGPVPATAYDAWPAGKIRVREAVVRANPPAATPGIIRHAPVIVQTLHSEAKLSLDPACPAAKRSTQLRVQLQLTDDAEEQEITVGESPPFYLCFSDIGGNVEIQYYSGELTNQPTRALNVEPEPRLLRVVTLKESLDEGIGQQAVVELSAFDSNLDQVGIPVDIRSSAPGVLAPNVASIQLSADLSYPTQVTADAVAPGTAILRITPRLLDTPQCDSDSIEVIESGFP